MAAAVPDILIPALNTPIAGNPVVQLDVFNAITYRKEVNKRRKLNPAIVTAQIVVDATVNEQIVVQRFAGEHVAPPWFAGAIAAALAPLLAPLEARTVLTEARTIRTETRVSNALAIRQEDTIIAPIIPPAVAAPQGFPATLLELQHLTNANCDTCMAAYDLVLPIGTPNEVAEKRRLLARFLGVRL